MRRVTPGPRQPGEVGGRDLRQMLQLRTKVPETENLTFKVKLIFCCSECPLNKQWHICLDDVTI